MSRQSGGQEAGSNPSLLSFPEQIVANRQCVIEEVRKDLSLPYIGNARLIEGERVAILLAALDEARRERDELGNALARERAKDGGSWDQAAADQRLADVEAERDRLRAKLELLEALDEIASGGQQEPQQ